MMGSVSPVCRNDARLEKKTLKHLSLLMMKSLTSVFALLKERHSSDGNLCEIRGRLDYF